MKLEGELEGMSWQQIVLPICKCKLKLRGRGWVECGEVGRGLHKQSGSSIGKSVWNCSPHQSELWTLCMCSTVAHLSCLLITIIIRYISLEGSVATTVVKLNVCKDLDFILNGHAGEAFFAAHEVPLLLLLLLLALHGLCRLLCVLVHIRTDADLLQAGGWVWVTHACLLDGLSVLRRVSRCSLLDFSLCYRCRRCRCCHWHLRFRFGLLKMHHTAAGGLRLQLIGEHLLIVPVPLEAQAEPQAVAKDAHCLAAGPELVNFIAPTAPPNWYSNSLYARVCVCVAKVCQLFAYRSRSKREAAASCNLFSAKQSFSAPPVPSPHSLCPRPLTPFPFLSLIQQFQFQLTKLDSEMRRTIYTFFVAYFCALPSSLRQRSFRLMSFVIMPSWIYNYASSNAP